MARRRFAMALPPAILFLAVSLITFAASAAPPQLVSAVSRQTHGPAGNFDIPLPQSANSGIECRSLSAGMMLVLTFDQPVTAGTAAVTAGVASVNGSPTFSGSTMSIKLSGVANAQAVTVTAANVVSGGGTTPSVLVSFRVLLADVTSDATVGLFDFGTVRNNTGSSVTGANFRSDLDHDGSVGQSDMDLLKSVYNTTVAGNPTDNTPPTISTVADQTAFSGKATAAVGFSVGDAESSASSLGVSASSSDQSLLPDSAITLGGASGSRTVSLTPAAGVTGNLTVTLTVSDGLATAGTSFGVTVAKPPTLFLATMTPQAAGNKTEGTGSSSLLLDGDETGATVRVTYSNLSTPKVAWHVHGPADPGQSGGILFDLDTATPAADGSFRWVFAPVGTLSVADIVTAIKAGRTYINVHTSQYPSGEIRGQYVLASGSQNWTPPAPPPPLPSGPPTANDAARFLTQATFGPTETEIARVQSIGFDAWLNEQFAVPATSVYDVVYYRCTTSSATTDALSTDRITETWWKNALTAPDQLRQRVAFAYSQIFVVSAVDGTINGQPAGLATYWDMLANDAFANFSQILKDVTLHPIMGQYLNMRGNVAPTAPLFQAPNENYAREVLQLFSIGLNFLQPDGTLKLGADGLPIPTYDQTTIQNFAKVFTGWNTDGTPVKIPTSQPAPATQPIIVNSFYNKPMVVTASKHSTAQKILLSYPAYFGRAPANVIEPVVKSTTSSSNIELDRAIQNIFNHPNVGPFIARRLIQRLVCSNPSPAYVYRVASVFNDDGSDDHIRGNMQAVVRAILTDYEARTTDLLGNLGYGHLREPLLRATAVIRAFHPTSVSGYFKISRTDTQLGQTALRAPTVFNFYEPDYVQPGDIANAGLFSPELQIVSETTSVSSLNFIYSGIYATNGWLGNDVKLDLTTERSLASNPSALLDRLNLLLMSGQMPADMKQRIVTYISSLSATDTLARARAAVHLVATSSQFSAEK